jgi:hypothetical protein
MPNLWYYRHDGLLVGPVRFDTLPGLVQSGVIGPDDTVRHGHGDWQAVRDVEELREYLDSTTHETSDATSLPDLQGPDDSLFASILQAAPVVDANYAPLDRVGAWGDATSPQPGRSEAPRYFLRIGRGEFGPFTVAVLQRKVDDGLLARADRCRADGSHCWVPASEIAELTFPAPTDSEIPLANPEPPARQPHVRSGGPTLPDSVGRSGIENRSTRPSISHEPTAHEFSTHESNTRSSPTSSRGSAQSDWQTPPMTGSPRPKVGSRETDHADMATVPTPAQRRPMPLESQYPEPHTRKPFTPSVKVSPGLLALLGLAALLLIFTLLPSSERTVRGEVLVNDLPVPVGSVSFTPRTGTGQALTMPILSGHFKASGNFTLSAGDYAVIVTVGNPLGMPLRELESSPVFSSLNGAKFQTSANATDENAAFQFQFSSSDAALPQTQGQSINTLQ